MKLTNFLNLACKDIAVLFNGKSLIGRFIEDNELEWYFVFGGNCFSSAQICEAESIENGYKIKSGYYNKPYTVTFKNNTLIIQD